MPETESLTPPLTKAIKYDTGKARYDLLPAMALHQIVLALTFGAKKYKDDNYRNHGGLPWMQVFAALMRHCWSWVRHEDLDPETGLHHLAHAGACVLMLLDLALSGNGTDNRWTYDKSGEVN